MDTAAGVEPEPAASAAAEPNDASDEAAETSPPADAPRARGVSLKEHEKAQKKVDAQRKTVEKLRISYDKGVEEAKKSKELEEEYKTLTDWMKETLGEKVEKVAVSRRLTDTPCVLVTSKFGWSANMERIMKAQAMGDSRASDYMKGKKTMEINPTSPVILDLKKKHEANDASAAQTAELLFDTAMLTSGFTIDQPAEFAAKIFSLMDQAVGAGAGAGDAEEKAEDPKKDEGDDGATETVEPEVV